MHHPILIIGGGLSGLSLARLLVLKRIPAIVFESSPVTRKQGYGITLRSWAYAPLISQLGIEATKFKTDTATDAPCGGRGDISTALVDATTGNPLVSAPPARDGQGEQDFFRANRSRLRDFFMKGVDIRFEHKLASFESVPGETDSITAHFENGESVKGRMLVGADGVFSTVRSLLLPDIQPTVFPAVVINGQQRLSRSEFDAQLAPFMRDTNVIIGLADNITLGISINDSFPSHVDISWTYSRPARPENDPLHLPHRTTNEAHQIPSEFFDELARLQTMNDDTGLSPPFSWVYDPARIRSKDNDNKLVHWLMRSVRIPQDELTKVTSNSDSPTVLIGDAAHAMPIFAGEGGNHALLDGYQLAQCIEKTTSGVTVGDAVREFHDGAYGRWQQGVEGSEKRLGGLHRPLEEWRKIASQK